MSQSSGLTFDLLTGDGRAFTLQLTQPVRSPEMSAYACEVVWSGMPLSGGPIFGETPLQSLECAMLFVRRLLHDNPALGEVTHGGRPFVVEAEGTLY